MTNAITASDASGPRYPIGLFAVAAIIPLIGVMNLYSAAKATRPELYLVQLGWACAAFLGAAVMVRIKSQTLEMMAYPFYGFVNLLLILVLVIGTPIKGAQRWLDLGSFNLQPSELAKLSIILVTARYFAHYPTTGGYTLAMLLRPLNVSRPIGLAAYEVYRYFHQRKALALAIKNQLPELPNVDEAWKTWALAGVAFIYLIVCVVELLRKGVTHRRIVAPIDIVMVPVGLVFIEPDLGTSMIVLAIAGTIILFCGMRIRELIIAAVVGVSISVFAWSFVLKDYQKNRVYVFLDPEADIQGAGYHAMQSMIAVGSGQLTGKGFGEGTQTQLSFLPENHTDFVFSVLGEEWGFVGGVVLILLFFTLVVLMLQGARKATDRFTALLAVGAASLLFWHVFINIGMVIGVLPVVGVTLPLMSYGGSSMITKVVAIGMAAGAQSGRRT